MPSQRSQNDLDAPPPSSPALIPFTPQKQSTTGPQTIVTAATTPVRVPTFDLEEGAGEHVGLSDLRPNDRSPPNKRQRTEISENDPGVERRQDQQPQPQQQQQEEETTVAEGFYPAETEISARVDWGKMVEFASVPFTNKTITIDVTSALRLTNQIINQPKDAIIDTLQKVKYIGAVSFEPRTSSSGSTTTTATATTTTTTAAPKEKKKSLTIVARQREKIVCCDYSHLQETVLYHDLIETFAIPSVNCPKPFALSRETLQQNLEQMDFQQVIVSNFLENHQRHQQSVRGVKNETAVPTKDSKFETYLTLSNKDLFDLCWDLLLNSSTTSGLVKRNIELNGFRVRDTIGETLDSPLELVAISDLIVDYGVLDFIEVLVCCAILQHNQQLEQELSRAAANGFEETGIEASPSSGSLTPGDEAKTVFRSQKALLYFRTEVFKIRNANVNGSARPGEGLLSQPFSSSSSSSSSSSMFQGHSQRSQTDPLMTPSGETSLAVELNPLQMQMWLDRVCELGLANCLHNQPIFHFCRTIPPLIVKSFLDG